MSLPPSPRATTRADDDLAWFSQQVRAQTAVVLDATKEYLVVSRLLPIARRHQDADVGAYLARLRRGATAAELWEAVEAMTTNETSWFRDGAPFLHLRDSLLPELADARARTRSLRVWSAACSTGQEPYGLSMVMLDQPELRGWRTEILATDVDRTVLAKARAATYSQMEVGRGLPAPMMTRHLEQHGASWQVSRAVRAPVRFAELNLAKPLVGTGVFDIIFCRNVLIYFDPPTKAQVLARLRSVLAPDGVLVLGAAETTLGISTDWTRDARSGLALYRPATGAAPRAVAPVASRPPVAARTVLPVRGRPGADDLVRQRPPVQARPPTLPPPRTPTPRTQPTSTQPTRPAATGTPPARPDRGARR